MVYHLVFFSFLSSREIKAREFLLRKERETLEATVNEEKQKTAEEAFQQDLEEFMKDPKPRSMSSKLHFFSKKKKEEEGRRKKIQKNKIK